MYTIIQVFLLNLATSIDNVIIIGGILGRSGRVVSISLCSALILTLIRTVLISGIHILTRIPGTQLTLGGLVLWVAFRTADVKGATARTESSFWQLLLMVVLCDFTVSMDTVMTLAAVTHDMWKVALGIFLSLLPLFLLVLLVTRVMNQIFWVRTLAAAFIAQLAVRAMLKDPLIHGALDRIHDLHLAPMGVSFIILVYGIIRKRCDMTD